MKNNFINKYEREERNYKRAFAINASIRRTIIRDPPYDSANAFSVFDISGKPEFSAIFDQKNRWPPIRRPIVIYVSILTNLKFTFSAGGNTISTLLMILYFFQNLNKNDRGRKTNARISVIDADKYHRAVLKTTRARFTCYPSTWKPWTRR